MVIDRDAKPTPLTAFNAIKLSARDVAKSFVPPPAFDQLVQAQNAILTGPRGSGKTTLLKMLSSDAIEHWAAPEATQARARLDAVGVFIASDRTWNEQLSIPKDVHAEASFAALAWSAFATHALRSLVGAMDYRIRGDLPALAGPHLRVELGPDREREVALDLSEYLALRQRAQSLPALSELLSRRLAEIGMLRRRLLRTADVGLPDWVDIDVLPVVNQAVERFNDACGEPERKWSLLFDELELAPDRIVSELLGALRGDQPRLLFKLSLAPADDRFAGLAIPGRPVAGQDYEHISLTYARKPSAIEFARRLATMQLSSFGWEEPDSVDRLLGTSLFDARDDPDPGLLASPVDPSPYKKNTPLWNAFARLDARDKTFSDYLVKNGVGIERLDDVDSATRAAKVRKVRNIVVTREYFRSDDGRRRSRKSSDLYSGAASMLSLPDGNPRMIIALVRQFGLGAHGTKLAPLTRSAQGTAIDTTLARFRALLQAQEPVEVDDESVSLIDFLDYIGERLAKRLVEEPFTDNVSLTFVIDADVRAEIRDLVARGVNAGALIHVPVRGDSAEIPPDLQGAQFRLCYLLCANYGLPLHLTRSTSLSSLMKPDWVTRPSGRRRRRRDELRGQDPLFVHFERGSE